MYTVEIKVGKTYYDSEQEQVVRVLEIENKINSHFPYLVGDLESTGDDNPLYGDAYWTDGDSLLGRAQILEELKGLRLEMTALNKALDLLKEN
jgi:hypothetical protein